MRPHAVISIAGPTAVPNTRIIVVATNGAVPLKSVKLTLNTSATPVNRIRVGKRSVSSDANDPFVNPAASPASVSTIVRCVVPAESAA